jgi:hypothetical protein
MLRITDQSRADGYRLQLYDCVLDDSKEREDIIHRLCKRNRGQVVRWCDDVYYLEAFVDVAAISCSRRLR